MKSDGTPGRPLVHVADIARAFVALLEAPRDVVHDEPFNVGSTAENYQIRDVAQIVESIVPDSRVTLADQAGPDLRNYRVNCDKLAEAVDFECLWTVETGTKQLYEAFKAIDLQLEDLEGSRYLRIARLNELLDAGDHDADLRCTVS